MCVPAAASVLCRQTKASNINRLLSCENEVLFSDKSNLDLPVSLQTKPLMVKSKY